MVWTSDVVFADWPIGMKRRDPERILAAASVARDPANPRGVHCWWYTLASRRLYSFSNQTGENDSEPAMCRATIWDRVPHIDSGSATWRNGRAAAGHKTDCRYGTRPC